MQPWEDERKRRRLSLKEIIKAITVSAVACTVIYGTLICQALEIKKNKKGNK